MLRIVFQLVVVVVLAVSGGGAWYLLAGQNGEDAGAGGPGMGGGQGDMPVPVVVAEAELGAIREQIEAVGTARAREAVEVVTKTSGRIAAIHFEEGERVREGDLLVELDAESERADVREAIAQREDLARQLERARRLLETRNVPEARVDELRSQLEAAEARVAAARSRVADREIRAPFDGVVGLREVSRGAYIEPQTSITTLDDVAVIRIAFSVPERVLARLEEGLPVIASGPALGEDNFEGRVTHIDSRVDPVTRAVRVQSVFDNEEGRLRPGMFLTVDLVLEERETVLVPEESLVVEGDRRYLFVVEDERARRVEVETGLRRRGEVEVIDGLEAGAVVVTSGLQRVRDGARVEILDDAPTT